MEGKRSLLRDLLDLHDQFFELEAAVRGGALASQAAGAGRKPCAKGPERKGPSTPRKEPS